MRDANPPRAQKDKNGRVDFKIGSTPNLRNIHLDGTALARRAGIGDGRPFATHPAGGSDPLRIFPVRLPARPFGISCSILALVRGGWITTTRQDGMN